MASPEPLATDPLAPIEPLAPQGAVVALGVPDSKDYPRLVFAAPYHTTVAIADIIQPSVLEAVQGILPTLVPPYVNQAAIDAVNALAVRRVGDTMSGALMLSPTIPTQPTMAATKSYVDTIVATVVPEVPPVPAGQIWGRQTGQWTPLGVGGTVTNIATGAGLTGGPITGTGTISMANMGGLTLKGNNSASIAAPADLTVAQTMTMLGAAPLTSPTFGGTPSLPTGTIAVTQPPTTNNTTVATTAFVANGFLAIPGGTMTGPIVLAGNAVANLNPVPLQQLTSVVGAYLPLAGGNVTGNLNVTGAGSNVGIGTTTPLARLVAVKGGLPPFQCQTADFVSATTGSVFQVDFGAASGNTYAQLYALTVGGNGFGNLVMQPGGGNVGIGTTGPGAKLDVVGAIRATGYVGTTTNDNAAAGQVGEVISSIVTNVTLPSGTTTNLTTISLTGGDWDVSAEVTIGAGGASNIEAAINTVSATLPSTALNTAIAALQGPVISGGITLALGACRQLLSATTTIYLMAVQVGGTGATGGGKIIARRAR